jgi:hypothetical protein
MRFVAAHLIQFVGYVLILSLFEEKVIARVISAVMRLVSPDELESVPADEDVRAEVARVRAKRGVASDAIVVDNAHKSFNFGRFGRPKVKAVDGVTLGIPKREVSDRCALFFIDQCAAK